jgi:hypothetical protein
MVNNKNTDREGKVRPSFNFSITALEEIALVTEAETISAVEFAIKFDDGLESEKITLPLNELHTVDLYKLHPHVTVYVNDQKGKRDFANTVRAALSKIPPGGFYQDKGLS